MSVTAIVSSGVPVTQNTLSVSSPTSEPLTPHENGRELSPRIPSVSQLVGPDPAAPPRVEASQQQQQQSATALPPLAPAVVVTPEAPPKTTKRRTSSRSEAVTSPAPSGAAAAANTAAPSKPTSSSQIDAEMEKKRQELADLDASLVARRKEFQTLETEILRSKMAIEQLRLEKQQMITSKSQIQEQIASTKETLADVVATLEQKMEQLTEISETLMDKQDRLDALNDRVRQKDQELKQKREDLIALTIAAAVSASSRGPAQPSPSASISRKSSANLPIIADAPVSAASTASDKSALPSAFSVDTGRGSIVDAREDTAASSSAVVTPKETGATFSESEPNRAASFAKLTAALAPKQMETLQQLHGDLSASEDVDDLTKRDDEQRKRRDAEVKKIMSTEIAASPNLRAALNRSTSNPSSTSEVSPRENGSATALNPNGSNGGIAANGGEEAPMISPRERKDKDKKPKTKKQSRDKDKHKDKDKDKDKDKEPTRKKLRTPKASAEYIATPSLPTPEPDEPPAPSSSSHKKVKTPKSSREKMPPLIHSDNVAPSSSRPSRTSNDAGHGSGSGTTTAEEAPAPSASRKSKTPKSSRERMPTTENGGSSGSTKKKTTSVREFTPFGAHTQPGAQPDSGYIKTPTLPPPQDLEDLELSVFNEGASKAASLVQALQTYQIHLDRLYVNIMMNVSRILSHIIKNFSDLRYTPEECDLITKILTDGTLFARFLSAVLLKFSFIISFMCF